MVNTERINVRGTIKKLKVGDKPLVLPRPDYVASMVRNTASSVRADTGRIFKVEVTSDKITVIRIK